MAKREKGIQSDERKREKETKETREKRSKEKTVQCTVYLPRPPVQCAHVQLVVSVEDIKHERESGKRKRKTDD